MTLFTSTANAADMWCCSSGVSDIQSMKGESRNMDTAGMHELQLVKRAVKNIQKLDSIICYFCKKFRLVPKICLLSKPLLRVFLYSVLYTKLTEVMVRWTDEFGYIHELFNHIVCISALQQGTN